MDALSRCFGLFTGLVLIGKKVAFSGIFAFSFLTTWGIIFVVSSLMVGFVVRDFVSIRARALSLAWVVTATVILMYWGYLFPRIDEKLDLNVILSHGGLLPFVTIEILQLGEPVHQSCRRDVLIFTVLYACGILIPLGLSGRPVYPRMTFNSLESWTVLALTVAVTMVGITFLKFLTSKFDK